jgi:TonB family protein
MDLNLQMNLKRIVVLLALCLAPVLAAADELENQIVKQYQNQVLGLRAPIGEAGQELDSAGKPVEASSGSPWTLYSGLLFVKKVSLKADSLNLEGDPLISFDARRTAGLQLGQPLKIRIHLEHQLRSADEAQQLMDRVFFLDTESLKRAKPEYRRSGATDEPIYHVGQDKVIRYPMSKYTPEPEMSEEARRAKYQGTVVVRVVVDKNGLVSRIAVVRSLGMGLDAEAVSTIRKWRFQPATREGQPVAVELNIETTFHLF